ncbi:MAG TPA: amidohydrolase family protein [Candidatus Binatia bacterium]|nr:amidohydrolase family protein [Candidatus Binatia bacterium]
MHDLVIRGGTVVDGTGSPPRIADVAIDGTRIAAVGEVRERGRETLDAGGVLVTPGFVDVHTHYDGQATWDAHLAPSCWHGVTTVVLGNCGVGFAPVRPDRHEWLIGLMEGVEDIPGAALSAGIRWEWETFPEYLDALARMPRVLDVGAQVPHGAVRAYVMGERGAANEPATPDDIAKMERLVREALDAGALGFTTSRTVGHRGVDGRPVPGTFASEEELAGIGRALATAGCGVFEVAEAGTGGRAAGDPIGAAEAEVAWMTRLSAAIGRPVSFLVMQSEEDPESWRRLLALAEEAAGHGADLVPQVAARPFGMLAGHQSRVNPFAARPTYRTLASLPLAERVVRLHDPEVRGRILAERPVGNAEPGTLAALLGPTMYARLFPLGDPPDYEPTADTSVAAIAAREGRHPEAVLYDLMLRHEGRELLFYPVLNYADCTAEPIREMILHPRSVLGLGDGGAHCGIVCDASMTTFMLTHWVRDRHRGPRIALETAVRALTRDPAALYGLHDRGVLRTGLKADINLIDLDRLRLRLPEMAFDLPAGARRLLQRAEGYVATVVSGQIVMREGGATGVLPGRLVRGGTEPRRT